MGFAETHCQHVALVVNEAHMQLVFDDLRFVFFCCDRTFNDVS